MTYIIEDKAGEEAARWKTNKNPMFPDGASASGVFPDGYVHKGGDGETYTVKEVTKRAKGDGPRHVGNYGPEKVKGVYFEGMIMGEALPPTPDPVPSDEGYDHSRLRKREYDKDIPFGDQADALLKWTTAIRMKQTAVDDAIDGITSITDDDEKAALKTALGPIFDLPADLDSIIGKWLAVKKRFPKE